MKYDNDPVDDLMKADKILGVVLVAISDGLLEAGDSSA